MPRLSPLKNCLASYVAFTTFVTFAPLELEQNQAINKRPILI